MVKLRGNVVVLEPLENIAKSRGKVNEDQLGKKKKIYRCSCWKKQISATDKEPQ